MTGPGEQPEDEFPDEQDEFPDEELARRWSIANRQRMTERDELKARFFNALLK